MRECIRLCSWWSKASSSSRLLLFMVPLIVVSASVTLLGPKSSNSIFISYYTRLRRSSSSPPPDSIASTGTNASSSRRENQTTLPPLVEKKEGILAVDGPHIAPFMNNTDHPLQVTERSQLYSNLERVEAGLSQARSAIREASSDESQARDPDYVPTGPMYWNATAFHRSYLEMEKQFKVFVYEEGDPPVFHYGPCSHTYAIEGLFIQGMEVSHFRTRDPEKAHVYFLPISMTMITQFVYVVGSHDWGPMKNSAKDYVDFISQKYHYWNRSLGADHFIIACHDWGPEISTAVPNLYNNSIRALCNANTSEQFNPSRDVSIPEILLPRGTTEGMIGGPSPSQRSVLVFYAGGVHGPIRPILLQHWENKDPDVQVYKYLPKNVSYYGMMRKSKYCLCPSGYEVASPRTVEALYMGCVPVLIKDSYVIPFSDVLNWKTFSVIVPVEDIPNLKKILLGISQTQYVRLQRRGTQVRKHFEINSPPKRFDVFNMILHSIWLRRLNIRVHNIQEP